MEMETSYGYATKRLCVLSSCGHAPAVCAVGWKYYNTFCWQHAQAPIIKNSPTYRDI